MGVYFEDAITSPTLQRKFIIVVFCHRFDPDVDSSSYNVLNVMAAAIVMVGSAFNNRLSNFGIARLRSD